MRDISNSPQPRREAVRHSTLFYKIRLLTSFPLQACLNAPEPPAGGENGVDGGDGGDSPEESGSHIPPPTSRPGMPQNPHMPGNYMPNMPSLDPQQALAYQNYVQRNQGYGSGMPQQPGMAPSSHHQS